MKVYELIQQLAKFDADLDVEIDGGFEITNAAEDDGLVILST
jgi:hypothetical protein